jgi:WD40 repeat protein
LPDGKHFETLSGHTSIESLTISPDNHILVSGGHRDKTIRLWNLPDGKHLKTLTGHNHCVSSLSMSPDGHILASGSDDGTVRLWDLSSTIAHITPINQFTSQNILEIESSIKDPKTSEDVRNAFNFILALIRLRQQFDIDIEDASDDIELSPFDIEIER